MAQDDFDRYTDMVNDIFETVWLEVDQEMRRDMENSSAEAVARWGFIRGYMQSQSSMAQAKTSEDRPSQ